MLKPPVYVFTDFDGTITREDLGDKIFDVFGRFSEYYPRLTSGELSVPEYWRLQRHRKGGQRRRFTFWRREQPAGTFGVCRVLP